MMARISSVLLCFFWATGILAFQNSHRIKRHNVEATSALQSRARESYTSNPPRRDEVRRGSKQSIKPSSIANNGKIKQERTVVIMYHKPPNVITSHSNADAISKTQTEQSRCTVYEDISTMKGFVGDQSITGKETLNFETATNIQSKLHAIGRLDAATTGLLLLTNDGNLVHQVTNPNAKQDNKQSKSVQKTYEALIMGHHELPEASTTVSANDETYPLVTLLEKGATLSPKHGGQTKPVDDLTILSHPTASTTLVSITISEGKNRQIRRMFHSIGSGVMKLHRVSVGKLSLAGLSSNHSTTELQEGEWRLLSEDEIRVGLGWECRWLDEVSPVAGGRRSRASGKRQPNTRSTKRRRRR